MPSGLDSRSLRTDHRATSSVVGVVLLVGVAVALAATVVGAGVALSHATDAATPSVAVAPSGLAADDGWPDGQTVRLRHRAGPPIPVAQVVLVVAVPDGRQTRLSGFPTLRLTDDHVGGADLVDRSYAGVDGELDAAHTDGRWEAGEVIEVRLARGHVDIVPGDRVSVTVVHAESDAVLAETTLVAR
jgi:FlaG/FlaF family flagellin (archaellin)